MRTVTLNLNEISKVQRFVGDISLYEEDIDVIRGKYVIDAKSLLGLFSLDLSKPVDVRINSDDDNVLDKFVEDMKKYE